VLLAIQVKTMICFNGVTTKELIKLLR